MADILLRPSPEKLDWESLLDDVPEPLVTQLEEDPEIGEILAEATAFTVGVKEQRPVPVPKLGVGDPGRAMLRAYYSLLNSGLRKRFGLTSSSWTNLLDSAFETADQVVNSAGFAFNDPTNALDIAERIPLAKAGNLPQRPLPQEDTIPEY